MLLLIFATSVLLGIVWFVWKNSQHYIGTENRHRFFAEFLKDFPDYHNAKTSHMKKKLFEQLCQMGNTINLRILEIGAGSGANLQFFPENTKLTVVDPNPFFKQHLDTNLAKYPTITLENYLVSGAENMKAVADHSIDAVVSTLVMCSVKDEQNIFQEIRRVLVPGGKFFFMEHVIDDKFSLVKVAQVILSSLGIFQFLFDGCRNDKDVHKEIGKGGFAKVDAKRFRLDLKDGVPFWAVYTIQPHLCGVATTAK